MMAMLLVAGCTSTVSGVARTQTPEAPAGVVELKQQNLMAAKKAIVEANRVIDVALMDPEKYQTFSTALTKYADPAGRYWILNETGLGQYREAGHRFDGLTKVLALDLVGDYDPDELVFYRCLEEVDVVDRDGKVVEAANLRESRLMVRRSDRGWRVWDLVVDHDGRFSREVDTCTGGRS